MEGLNGNPSEDHLLKKGRHEGQTDGNQGVEWKRLRANDIYKFDHQNAFHRKHLRGIIQYLYRVLSFPFFLPVQDGAANGVFACSVRVCRAYDVFPKGGPRKLTGVKAYDHRMHLVDGNQEFMDATL
jgi:hypothetical protein